MSEMHEPVVPKRREEKREQEAPAVKPVTTPVTTPANPFEVPEITPATVPDPACPTVAPVITPVGITGSWNGFKVADAMGDTMMGENFSGGQGGNAMTGQINPKAVSVTDPGIGQGISPGEGSTTITSSWKSDDYLNTIKQGSDSDIYFRGMADGRAGKEMDETLAALSDDYFNGWQDGKVYKHAPTEEAPPRLLDMNPGTNNIPSIHANLNPNWRERVQDIPQKAENYLVDLMGNASRCGWEGQGCGTDLTVALINKRKSREGIEPACPRCQAMLKLPANQIVPPFKKKRKSSIDRECIECGSIRIAHCGEPGCADEEGNEKGKGKPVDANTFPMQVAGSTHYCKNCMNTGIVCGGCGSPKVAGALDDDESADEIDNDFISSPYGRDPDEPHDEDCDCDSCFLGQYDTVQDDDDEYEGEDEDHDDEDHSDMSDEHYNQD